MPAFDPGFPGVAGHAQRLQIARFVGKFGVCSDGADMVNLQPATDATGPAPEAVTFQNRHAQRPPAFAAGDTLTVPLVFLSQAHDITDFLAGSAAIRAPWATARTVAAAASIRPVDRAFASFRLLAGSRRQIAS